MSPNPTTPPPQQQAQFHGAELCYWLREKEYVTRALDALTERVTSIDTKLDKYVETAVAAKQHEKEIDDLSKKVGISREEIAALKVKASLLGICSAALLEIVFMVIKNWGGK